ncbi:MAG: DUF1987 domain-containing protein [Salinivirgaceae bacterium]|jgi:hypothetical protein|nr:DUF1987 domain-containing protein [Salinivirgaceae bacterium]
MKPFIIEETAATPRIVFDLDENKFELKGCSRPEDVRDFYAPVIKWLNNFKDSVDDDLRNDHKEQPIVFKFKFDYFNSSSAKFILDILVLINRVHTEGLNIRIDWYFDESDDDMKEVGEELSEVVDFPFEYVVEDRNLSTF